MLGIQTQEHQGRQNILERNKMVSAVSDSDVGISRANLSVFVLQRQPNVVIDQQEFERRLCRAVTHENVFALTLGNKLVLQRVANYLGIGGHLHFFENASTISADGLHAKQ